MKNLFLLITFLFCVNFLTAQVLFTDPLYGGWNKRTLLYCEGEDWIIQIPAKAIKDKSTKDLVKPISINDSNYTLTIKKGVINIKDNSGYNALISSADGSFAYVDDIRYDRVKKHFRNYIAYVDEAGTMVVEAELNTILLEGRIEVLDAKNPHLEYLLALAFEEIIQRAKTMKVLDNSFMLLEVGLNFSN